MKNIYLDDSIAAVSTPIGSGGISIIRISGRDSVEVADKIFISADGKKLADKRATRSPMVTSLTRKQARPLTRCS